MNRNEESASFPSSVWMPVLLLVCGLAFRAVKLRLGVGDPLGNFAPWMALAFTGAIVFPRKLAWWAWPAALLVVDVAVQGAVAVAYLGEIWTVYACFALAAVWGGSLRQRVGVAGVLVRVIGCTAGFYLVTNTQAWLVSAAYEKTFAGWLQALTTGVPGFPPTFVFLRNSLVSDVAFSLALLFAYNAEAVMRRLETIPLVSRRAMNAAA